jgi:serpin B
VGIGVVSAPPVLQVDRPFIFAIRERLSGTILFLGKIVNPTANRPREIESPPEECA